MTSKDRAKRAIHFFSPDRTPHFLPDGEINDIIWLWSKRPDSIKPWTNIGDHDEMIDHWGTTFRRVADGIIGRGEVYQPALPDISRQADYNFPDMRKPEFFEDMQDTIQCNAASENPKYVLATAPYCSLNEGTHNVMGLENMMLSYYEEPDNLKAFISRMAEAQKESIEILAELGCDGIMFYDDWGLQTSLMCSCDIIETFFMPHYRTNWGYARELGLDVWLHSCGHIINILDRFIDAGLNVIQMDQQENMGIDLLNERFGGRLSFWCPVDIQRTMINGTLDDIRNYAKKLVHTLGGHNGGFISMAYSTPQDVNHTEEKIMAMSEAFRQA